MYLGAQATTQQGQLDRANTADHVVQSREPDDAVAERRAEYKLDKTFTIFGEITNLFNKAYASSTMIVDQARADQAAFLPGDGRSFYAGIKARF